jgi:hypothetical protein
MPINPLSKTKRAPTTIELAAEDIPADAADKRPTRRTTKTSATTPSTNQVDLLDVAELNETARKFLLAQRAREAATMADASLPVQAAEQQPIPATRQIGDVQVDLDYDESEKEDLIELQGCSVQRCSPERGTVGGLGR